MTTNIFDTVGTAKVIKSSGGDAAITMTSKATATGRISGRLDLGAILASGPSARATWYRWDFRGKCQATGLVVGNPISLYLPRWHDDATPARGDGDIGSTDADYNTANKLKNLPFLGTAVVDDTAGATWITGDGLVWLPFRYVSLVVWNGSGATWSATATDCEFYLTPVNPQLQ